MGGQCISPHLHAICFACSELGISSLLHKNYEINLSVTKSPNVSSSSTNQTPFSYLLLLGYGYWRSLFEVGAGGSRIFSAASLC